MISVCRAFPVRFPAKNSFSYRLRCSWSDFLLKLGFNVLHMSWNTCGFVFVLSVPILRRRV